MKRLCCVGQQSGRLEGGQACQVDHGYGGYSQVGLDAASVRVATERGLATCIRAGNECRVPDHVPVPKTASIIRHGRDAVASLGRDSRRWT